MVESKTTDHRMVAWAEQHATINEYGTKCYGPFVCHIMNLFDRRVHRNNDKEPYECKWVAPYGFVPEAGCPDHD